MLADCVVFKPRPMASVATQVRHACRSLPRPTLSPYQLARAGLGAEHTGCLRRHLDFRDSHIQLLVVFANLARAKRLMPFVDHEHGS